MKIAIQGLESSFHALAARQLFGEDSELMYCRNFNTVFETLASNQADQAVVAIENSLYGSINEVYDLLLKYNFWITHEAYEQINLQLLGPPGARLNAITDVYSQAPALAEAEAFLNSNLPNAEHHQHQDTALAAKEVAQWGDPKKAAIASMVAAQQYGLEILASNIETHPQNYTRFIALQAERSVNSQANKFTLTFRTKDAPGSLHAALGVFADHKANLTKIESRPIVGAAWQYMYYVDCSTTAIEPIMTDLPQHASHIRLLGAYRAGEFNHI